MLAAVVSTLVRRGCGSLLQQTKPRPLVQVPKRNWAQVGHIISTPPRVHVSGAEQVMHMIVMYVVWIMPVMWFLSQIKVWRRQYRPGAPGSAN